MATARVTLEGIKELNEKLRNQLGTAADAVNQRLNETSSSAGDSKTTSSQEKKESLVDRLVRLFSERDVISQAFDKQLDVIVKGISAAHGKINNKSAPERDQIAQMDVFFQEVTQQQSHIQTLQKINLDHHQKSDELIKVIEDLLSVLSRQNPSPDFDRSLISLLQTHKEAVTKNVTQRDNELKAQSPLFEDLSKTVLVGKGNIYIKYRKRENSELKRLTQENKALDENTESLLKEIEKLNNFSELFTKIEELFVSFSRKKNPLAEKLKTAVAEYQTKAQEVFDRLRKVEVRWEKHKEEMSAIQTAVKASLESNQKSLPPLLQDEINSILKKYSEAENKIPNQITKIKDSGSLFVDAFRQMKREINERYETLFSSSDSLPKNPSSASSQTHYGKGSSAAFTQGQASLSSELLHEHKTNSNTQVKMG